MSTASNAPRVPAIAADLRQSIVSGDYGPGHQLPSARVLADRYKAGKNTVNAAIDQLKREGLVIGKPRAGWFVAERPTVTEVRRAQVSTDRPATVERVSARPATPEEATELGVPAGSLVLEVRTGTRRDGQLADHSRELFTATDHALLYELPAEE